MAWMYSPSFQVDLLVFLRNDLGVAQYQYGPRGMTTLYGLDFAIDYTRSIMASDTEDEEHDAITVAIDAYLLEQRGRFKHAILLDNDDEFLRNMVPPHAFSQLGNMLTDEQPMVFTPDVVPPPSRLNLPFFVGRNQTDLYTDLLNMLRGYLLRGTQTLSFRFGFDAVNPVQDLVITQLSSVIDSSGMQS